MTPPPARASPSVQTLEKAFKLTPAWAERLKKPLVELDPRAALRRAEGILTSGPGSGFEIREFQRNDPYWGDVALIYTPTRPQLMYDVDTERWTVGDVKDWEMRAYEAGRGFFEPKYPQSQYSDLAYKASDRRTASKPRCTCRGKR